MKILSIETSCDETAVSIVDITGPKLKPKIKVLGNALYSQIKIHEKYGGVFPNLAKREHQKNLTPLFLKALKEAGLLKKQDTKTQANIEKILEREPKLLEDFKKNILTIKKPDIDLIAVTAGPGLEPALWVGINFARALSLIWDIKIVPVNHMEGHIASSLLTKGSLYYPILSLLISGGHTELVLSKKHLQYKILGETKDDALGESYDKVARMLSLAYPGGPKIAELAEHERKKVKIPDKNFIFPRPMLNSKDLNFSFSGLKTSVLYRIQKEKKITQIIKRKISRGFEDAVLDVLQSKTKDAITKFHPRTLIIAGGVIANTTIRHAFENLVQNFPKTTLNFPPKEFATDNSVMIAIAAYWQKNKAKKTYIKTLKAKGNLKLGEKI